MKKIILAIAACTLLSTCKNSGTSSGTENFDVIAQSFGDLQTLRYEVPGFDKLSDKQKELAYYLYEAAMCGRDIIYDQKSKYGLLIRKTIENIYGTYKV
jgi:dipeptidyl-peptidase III